MAVASDEFVVDGRYEVGDVLGRGGMGEVRRARDLRLNRDVAIKFLRADLAADPESRRRFEEEAHNAARLNHPNVVIVLDSGEHAGQPYLVMECLPGRTLRDELREGPLSDARVTWIGRDVLAALAAAHEAGVIHRDVSPSNILLTDTGRAKLADFGIAKAVEDANVTISGQVLGTPGYLAPERLRGEPATPASDMYALGVTLKRALGDAAPGDPALATALDRMTDPEPDRRPTAALALGALGGGELEPETTALPVVTQTVAVPVVTQVVDAVPAPLRRDQRARIATVAIALVVGALLLVASNHSGGATASSQDTTPSTTTVTLPPTTIAVSSIPARAKTPATPKPAPHHKGKGHH